MKAFNWNLRRQELSALLCYSTSLSLMGNIAQPNLVSVISLGGQGISMVSERINAPLK
jgi:hypothetical protein